ncbi:MAG: NTP transferase domain-containing protein [Promethearchaeota archaeon]
MSATSTKAEVKEAIVLAAGLGSRIRPCFADGAKPLIPVLGTPLLEYVLKCLDEIGISRTVVVTGKEGESIHSWLSENDFLMKIDPVYNANYTQGNGISAKVGLKHVTSDSVLIVMADHLAQPDLYESALNKGNTGVDLGLVVDYNPSSLLQLNDATKVFVNKRGGILEIGKDIKRWNCVDTGVFLVSREFSSAVTSVVRRAGDCTMTEAVRHMIAAGMGVQAWDSNGTFWLDIDTPSDLERAERFILNNPRIHTTFELIVEEKAATTQGSHDMNVWSSSPEGGD